MAGVRRNDLDLLKGIAILAVVLYHTGLLPSGYLGVDIFFVLGGYMVFPKITEQVRKGEFRYFRFLANRLIRLLPLLLIVSAVCMVVGYVLWLPDDYENLAESVTASVFFSNNILSAITTGNYWDTVNEFKPLMHTWYLGILMEFYLIMPLLVMALNKAAFRLKRDPEKTIFIGFFVMTAASLLMFLFFPAGTAQKFYYLPYRFYELSAGGLIGIVTRKRSIGEKKRQVFSGLFFAALAFMVCIGFFSVDPEKIGVETWIIGNEEAGAVGNQLLIPNEAALLLTVLFTALFLLFGENSVLRKSVFLSAIGKSSYSIYIWHQALLALYRYSVSTKITVPFLFGFTILVAALTALCYRFIEHIYFEKKSLWITLPGAAVLTAAAMTIYIHAGVVRDIPELDIKKDTVHRNMHAEYCDRIFAYQDSFPEDNGLENVLVVGNSFARDFGNILLESEYADRINLSYQNVLHQDQAELIRKADRIFYFSAKEKIPDFVWELAKNVDVIYGIGTKNYGTNNGQIYAHRFSEDYFEQTVEYDGGYKSLNESWLLEWGDHYVDLMHPVLTEEGRIRVFTDDQRYISQDCRHLTKGGAEYYARVLNLETFLL